MRVKITLGITNATAYEQLLRDPDTLELAPQSGRVVFRLPEFEYAVAAAFRAMSPRNNAATPANAGHLTITATGQVAILATTGAAVNTSTYTTAPATRYDLQMAITPGTTATNGVLEYRLTKWDDTSIVYATASVGGVNTTGPSLIKGIRYAATSPVTVANTIRFGIPQAKAQATGWIDTPASAAAALDPDTYVDSY